MSSRTYKALLALVAIVLLVGVSFTQRSLSRQRGALGLNRYTELKGAPPVLQLTTVALGGFRGLISNALWMRANELQENDKYFEMVQLADWITKLEPHFTQVWLFESWNMAYNISVKFKDAPDRWRWVQRGIELLRDDGLSYNPNDVLIHRELAGFFQHKMGANMDDAHLFYKKMWANDMAEVLGIEQPKWDELLNPKTEDEKKKVTKLREKYKLDPAFMKQVDERYGPMEWKLPEAHAVYWAAEGLEAAKRNDKVVDPKDIITLHRMIYQSMQLSFQRGKMVIGKVGTNWVFREFVPNLAIIPKVSKAYEEALTEEEAKNWDNIKTAHRNFLRDAVFFLYTYNQMPEAARWYKYMGEKYPEKPLLEGMPNTLPRNISLDDYAIGRIQGEMDSPGQDKAKVILTGLERSALESLAVGEDDRFAGFDGIAQKVWKRYQDKMQNNQQAIARLPIPTVKEIRQDVLRELLQQLPPELTAQLRTRLGLPADYMPAPKSSSISQPEIQTNAPAAKAELAPK